MSAPSLSNLCQLSVNKVSLLFVMNEGLAKEFELRVVVTFRQGDKDKGEDSDL